MLTSWALVLSSVQVFLWNSIHVVSVCRAFGGVVTCSCRVRCRGVHFFFADSRLYTM